jgi:hypothetical protein
MDAHTNEFGAKPAKAVQLSSKIMSPDHLGPNRRWRSELSQCVPVAMFRQLRTISWRLE